jgi:hypothetical protein
MTSIFLIIFVLHGGHPYSVEVGQYATGPACQASMEEVFDDLQAQGLRVDQMTAACIDSGLVVAGLN